VKLRDHEFREQKEAGESETEGELGRKISAEIARE